MNQILPLPSGRLRKLKPGVYIDPTYKDLRLVVGDSGDRKWIFRYVLGTTMFKDIQLGDSKMSHDEARRSAREQRRILASGKDPAKS
jgi:Arm DNA-binding domain